MHVANAVPCQQMAGLVARSPALVMKPLDPWGVQLVGSSSDQTALAAYRRLQERYARILGCREPRVFHHGLARGSMGGRGSTSGQTAVPVPRNCARSCVLPRELHGAAQLNLIVANPTFALRKGNQLPRRRGVR